VKKKKGEEKMNRGITVLLLLITFIVSCTASCDCYSFWICDGPDAALVYPDQCSAGPPDYYGPGVVIPGQPDSANTFLIHTTNPDQAYRFVGTANCVEHVSFGNCNVETVSVRTDLDVEFTCDGTALCLADATEPASLDSYTFDQAGGTIGCNNTCFSTATNCTISESLVPNACTVVPIDALDWCLTGSAAFTTTPALELAFDMAVTPNNAAAWITQPFNIGVNGFRISATVEVGNNGVTTPADGFAVVVQQDPNGCSTQGMGGGGIGYDGIINALAVEFDDFTNGWDPNNHHIGVQASPGIGQPVDQMHGDASTVISPITVAPIGVSDGTLFHSIFVQYDATNTALTVFYDGNTIINAVNIGAAISQLGLTNALVGFTASTGSAVDSIIITDVQFSSP